VSAPTNPVRVGGLDRANWWHNAQRLGNYVWLAGGHLFVLNAIDPAAPTLVTNIDIIGSALDLQVVGDYGYFAAEVGGLSIYSVTNPVAPRYVTNLEIPGPFATSVAVQNSYAYLGEDMTGLHVIDIHDPAHPLRVSGQAIDGAPVDLAAVDDSLFIAQRGVDDVSVFDLSDPTQPTRVASYATDGAANRLRVVGNYVFVADGQNGLVILEAQPLRLPKLQLTLVETNAVVSWPVEALGFVLEATFELNATNWVPVVQTPRVTNTAFEISVPLVTNQFYRLRQNF